MPLCDLPHRAPDQGRLCPDPRSRNWDAIGGHHRNRGRLDGPKTTRRPADVLGCGHDVVARGRVRREGHHEVLNNIGAVLEILNFARGQSVDVHATGHHLDDVLAGQRGFEHHALHIIDRIEDRIGHTYLHHLEGIGARSTGSISGACHVVTDEHLTRHGVGHDEV